jgi:hypothetical protein
MRPETRSAILQSILWFMLQNISGVERSDAITEFTRTELCKRFGDGLTVGDVYKFAEIGGYSQT